MTPSTATPRHSLRLLLALALLAPALTGCLHQNFYVDPKPKRASYDHLRVVKDPKPVQLVFDVYNEAGPFPGATQKLAPKVLEVVTFSGLFSSIVKVGSDNMPRLQLIITVAPLPGRGELPATPLPPEVSSNLPGTDGGLVYTLTGTYQSADQPAVKKIYHNAVHVATNGPRPAGAKKMRAIGAVEDVVEQMLLSFLRDLQLSGKL